MSYEDIINLPHHVSKVHTPMSMTERAAQFSPFAALTGYEAAIMETARLTDRKAVLDNSELIHINNLILEALENRSEIDIVYFVEDDKKKEGGSYQDITGIIRKIDDYEGRLIMDNGCLIPLEDIVKAEIKKRHPE